MSLTYSVTNSLIERKAKIMFSCQLDKKRFHLSKIYSCLDFVVNREKPLCIVNCFVKLSPSIEPSSKYCGHSEIISGAFIFGINHHLVKLLTCRSSWYPQLSYKSQASWFHSGQSFNLEPILQEHCFCNGW